MVPKTLLTELRLTIRLNSTWRASSATTIKSPRANRSPSRILLCWQMAPGYPVSAKALWQWADVQTECLVYKVSHISQIYARVCLGVAVLQTEMTSHWSLSYYDPRWDQQWPLTLLLFIPGWNSGQFAAMWGTAVHPQAEEHTSASFLHENPSLQAHLCSSLQIPRRPAHSIAKAESKWLVLITSTGVVL